MKKKKTLKIGNIVENSLIEFELMSGFMITIHDLNRFFSDEEGNTLLGARRQSHRRCSICASSPKEICIEHCLNEINAKASSCASDFFYHKCHMGISEIVIPLRHSGIHCATVFAGKWKTPGRKKKNPYLTGKAAEKYKKLEIFKSASAKALAELLTLLGRGLLVETQQISDTIPQTRKAQILQFIRKGISKSMSLNELSKELHLSPSRTCHFVKEMFGISFSKLLNRERLMVTKGLLLSTDLLISEIAAKVGISSEFHFNRLFKKFFGLPPGKYRKEKNKTIEE